MIVMIGSEEYSMISTEDSLICSEEYSMISTEDSLIGLDGSFHGRYGGFQGSILSVGSEVTSRQVLNDILMYVQYC